MSGIDNIFKLLKEQGANAAKGFEGGKGLRPFSKPPEDGAEDFLEESLNKLFDREDLENLYTEAINNPEDLTNVHDKLMVPSLKNDFVASFHRDIFLRTHSGGRIKRFIAEASRRVNQAENVHEERNKQITTYENISKEDTGIGGASSG
tara:strand:+ start:243 stop:689 length:447 start_codon:yes stop_codon:yes gene_type:complete